MPQATPIVFVVDDDVSVRELLDLMIRFAGWQPKTFASAQEFLAEPRARVPSCLILDLNLPGLNGLDLQKRVASDRMDMPIIFITGYGDVPVSVQAMKAGAVEFLTKPFSDEVILEAIRQAIERSRVAFGHETERQALHDRYASLSARERQVMALVVTGQLNKQVGFQTRHQRDHREGAPGQGHAKNEGGISRRPRHDGRKTLVTRSADGN